MAARTRRKRTSETADIVVIGGGVMGCACAYRLAANGARVTVLERNVPGAEASSAAAGIVGALSEAHGPGPMLDLMLASRQLHPTWAQTIQDETSIDVGFRTGGILQVAFKAPEVRALVRRVAWQRGMPGAGKAVDRQRVHALEPLVAKTEGGVFFPDDARIDPPLFFRGVRAAAERAGVTFRNDANVERVLIDRRTARGVRLQDGTEMAADAVLVAAGSWTSQIGDLPLVPKAVMPARGQIIEVETTVSLLGRIVLGPRCYIVPRDDGRALIGSTLEFVGYRKEVTAGAIRGLLNAAIELVPDYAEARLRGTWSNFRPYTQDELPILGEASIRKLYFATGHYRTGILLAPITAECIVALVKGARPPVDLAAFSPERVRPAPGPVESEQHLR